MTIKHENPVGPILGGQFKIASLALAVVAATCSSQAFSAVGEVTPDVIFGAGNVNSNWTVNTDNGVEVGLRAKNRTTGEFGQVGTSNVYNQQAGTTGSGALWNYE